jgi:hypothetical protein
MQSQRIFTIEKPFLHCNFKCKASFIYREKVWDSLSHWKFKTQMHFWDSENALFEKFEGQKTAFRSGNTCECPKYRTKSRNRSHCRLANASFAKVFAQE